MRNEVSMHPKDGRIRVIADDRERSSEIISAFSRIKNVSLSVKRLSVGDYLVDDRLMFERKTLNDLAVSIIDGRLFKQMIRLARSHYKAVLILEGTGKDLTNMGIRREALQGALITVNLILGIPILRSKAPSESARLIVYAAQQINTVIQGCCQRQGYRPKGRQRRQMFILQGLPGVGRDRAERLLNAFGTVEAVIMAGTEDLQRVDGIGQKTAEKIKWAVSEEISPYGLMEDFPI